MDIKKKVGPLPLWAWLLIGAIGGYIVYRHAKGTSGSSGQAVEMQQVVPQTSSQSAMGAATQAGSPTDTGQTTQDYLQALGAENATLVAALTQTNTNIEELAASQIAALQTQTNSGSFNMNTQPVAGVEPNSNTPTVIYVTPTVVTTPPSAPQTLTPAKSPVASVKTAAKTAATRYYTYKRDVPLGPGQTVHFTANRGYHAA